MNRLITLVGILMLLATSIAHAASVRVAGIDRDGNFAFGAGATMADARASLLDPNNFGPLGIIDKDI